MLTTIRALVAGATVVKCNAHEAAALAGEPDSQAAGRALCGLGPEVVAVTLGVAGALAVSRDEAASVPARRARAVDATGAGDSVAGVLAAGLAAGAAPNPRALAPVLEVAMATAAGVVAVWGATEGLPSADDARARLTAALSAPPPPESVDGLM